jgi:transmembrane sensor
MDQTKIKQILDEFKKKDLSAGERTAFERILENPENEKTIKDCLYNELNNSVAGKTDTDIVSFPAVFRRIRHRINTEAIYSSVGNTKSRKIGYQIARIAAVFLIALITGGLLSYLYFTRSVNEPVAFFEITTPLASTSHVLLPDRTEVILNAGSKIKYNNAFNNNNRSVHLDGEAFFRVSENKQLPFIVATSYLDIKALGTEFNVKAYSDEKVIVATLVKGKIEILNNRQIDSFTEPVILEPNQKAVFVKEQDKIAVSAIREIEETNIGIPSPRKDTMYVIKGVDTKPAVVWTENKLIVSRESMASLAVKLERKYDVVIRFADEEVKHFRFTGTLLDETIQQVLDAIKLTSPIYYTMEGKTITIYENRKMKDKFRQHLKQN